MEIKLDNISTNSLKNITLTIESCKITGFYGNNIVELLESISSYKEYEGKIKFNSKKEKIGYMLKDSEPFLFKTVLKEMNFNNKLKKSEIKVTLELVGLDETFLKRNPNTLSSSEKKKLSLALLIINFDTLVLDEPTANYDYHSKRNFITVLRNLKKEGKTIIILSNDIDLLYTISDNICISINDKVIIGSKNDIFKNKELKDLLLPLPETIAFSNYALKEKKIRLGYRDDINDLIKDIYRHAS